MVSNQEETLLVKEWMTPNPITVTPKASIMKASQIIKSNVRRLPVVDNKGKVVGISTDRDLKEARPSMATTLAVHRFYTTYSVSSRSRPSGAVGG